jgi:hypothetical protein
MYGKETIDRHAPAFDLFAALHESGSGTGLPNRDGPRSRRVLEGKRTNHGHWTFGAEDPAA